MIFILKVVHIFWLMFLKTSKKIKNLCLKIYHLDSVKFLSAPGLACQMALNKTDVKLELLTDIDMLLMV